MSSSRVGVALSKRLSKIKSYYENERYVWDIGCDHGDLGLSFSNCDSVEAIHLVDPSSKVINQLKVKLKDSYITKQEILIHHENGQRIKINQKNNIIFIAGMGGKEIGEIIQSLLPLIDSTSKIIISPHKNILELRVLLNQLALSLIDEDLVFENNQYYQLIVLRPDLSFSTSRVSLFGSVLWTKEHSENYRNHLLKYFITHRGALSQDYVNYLKSLVF
jgi:tRNA (adenine22-N1)-methyltransferase